jgi:nudix-type nucleoside diphosphatase (YffH/AdpP family)
MVRILRSRTPYEGYATVTVLTLAGDDGAEHDREVISFGQSACVLPYDPDRRVALVARLPRAPLLWEGYDPMLVEAPAGMIEAGETAQAAARREALEEVGVVLEELESVAACWPSPGVVAERSHLFLSAYGQGDREGQGGGVAHEHEGIVAEEIPLTQLWQVAEAGELRDMKTLTLVLALRLRRPELF